MVNQFFRQYRYLIILNKESFIFIERMKPKIKKKQDKHFSLNIYIILSNDLTKIAFNGFSQSYVLLVFT